MATFVFNISIGRAVEFYRRVKLNDPANAAFVVVPIEATGLEAAAAMRDRATLADVLAQSTNEQTTMGRKTLTDVELAAVPTPDNVNDRYDLSFPELVYTGANALGNAIGGFIVGYWPDTTVADDTTIVPVGFLERTATPDGNDMTFGSGGWVFFRGTAPAV